MERLAGLDPARTADRAAGDGADFRARPFSAIVDRRGQSGRAADAEDFLNHAGLDAAFTFRFSERRVPDVAAQGDNPRPARWTALLVALAGLACAALGIAECKQHAGFGALTDVANAPWVAELGIRYHLAADGISLVLVLLTGIAVAWQAFLFWWYIESRGGEFFALYHLRSSAASMAFFLSVDLFLLFVFYEIAIYSQSNAFLIAHLGI